MVYVSTMQFYIGIFHIESEDKLVFGQQGCLTTDAPHQVFVLELFIITYISENDVQAMNES